MGERIDLLGDEGVEPPDPGVRRTADALPVGAGPERPPRQERDDFDQAAIFFAPVAPCLQQDGKELASEVVPEIRQRAVHADLIPTDRKRSNKNPRVCEFCHRLCNLFFLSPEYSAMNY